MLMTMPDATVQPLGRHITNKFGAIYTYMCINSASLSINTVEYKRYRNRVFAYPNCWSICRFVWKVYCGKTANWIQMLFGVVNGDGQGMGVLDVVPCAPREGEVLRRGGFICIGLNCIFLKQK